MLRVSLTMYDLPEVQGANDLLWQGLRGHLAAAGFKDLPDKLDRTSDNKALWRDRDLLLSQTCGYPLMTAFGDSLQLVATPNYGTPGCKGPTYSSFILLRKDDPATSLEDCKGYRLAINTVASQSGMNILRFELAKAGLTTQDLGPIEVTGAHRLSLAAVADGRADLASLDCVTFTLTAQEAPGEIENIRILKQTAVAPCLPYVTALQRSVEEVTALRAALQAVATDPSLIEARERLRLRGFTVLGMEDYQIILQQQDYAEAKGLVFAGCNS